MRWVLATLLLVPVVASAEGVGPQGPSDANRVRGARELVRLGDGLVSLGGRKLRHLAPGSGSWRVLHEQPGELSTAGVDAKGGRVLAAWEQDSVVHYATLRPARTVGLALPPLQSLEGTVLWGINHLAFATNGRDALVVTYGLTGNVSEHLYARGWRVPLDGKTPATLSYRVDSGMFVAGSPRGAVFMVPKAAADDCSYRGCIPARLVVYLDGDAGVEAVTLVDAAQQPFGNAEVVAGSDDERLVLQLRRGTDVETFATYRWGERKAEIFTRPVPKLDGELVFRVLPPGVSDALLHVHRRGSAPAIAGVPAAFAFTLVPFTAPAAQEPPVAQFGGGVASLLVGKHGIGPRTPGFEKGGWRPQPHVEVYGSGLRADGSVWLHRGDELLLIGKDGVTRAVDLVQLVGGRPEWAGAATYVDQPESLWIGVEIGAGRDFVRRTFSDLERAARPWPEASR